MKIVIAGAGEVGRHIAESLSTAAHHTVVIEADDRLASELEAHLDAKVICGNASSVNTLLEAGASECDLFLALTSSNNTNLVCCSLASSLGARKTICRVHPEVQREEWLFDFKDHFKANYLFSSERLASIQLSKHIRSPNSIFVEEIARGHIELQQLKVSLNSSLVGKPLKDLKLPERIRVGGIQRDTELIIPTAQDELMPGDIVTMVGEPRKIYEIAGKLGKGVVQESLRVIIFGGGEYGFSLAQMLESWDCKVRILESDQAICEDLSNRLDNTTILNVDATSLAELREERVGDADFFVATSTSDEDNVMTCLQAKNLGAKNCLSLIHRADYADAISSFGQHFGIMAAVSPREATRLELMRFVTSDRYHVVKGLQGAEIIEAHVTETCALADQQISDISWPDGSLLVAKLHGMKASVPAAGDTIQPGDSIYAMVADSAKKEFLKLLTSK